MFAEFWIYSICFSHCCRMRNRTNPEQELLQQLSASMIKAFSNLSLQDLSLKVRTFEHLQPTLHYKLCSIDSTETEAHLLQDVLPAVQR